MINLLPPEVKQSIVYARRNTRLRSWVFVLFLGIAVIAAIVAAGHLYMDQSIHTYAVQVQQGQDELKAQKLDETQKQVQDITGSLQLVVQVLQREILFSKLLSQVGAALPNGSVLTNLSINKVQGGLDISAAAADYQTGTQVQLNLQDPTNKIFDKADIVSIQCAGRDAATSDPFQSQYPCTVQIRAQFAKVNPFLFITPAKGSAK